MTIGTKFFTDVSAFQFSRIEKNISDLQRDISAGKNDPRASKDLVRASRLSVAKEQQVLLERYANNLQQAENRLDQTDTVLGETTNIMQRLQEISIRAVSGSVSDDERQTLRLEVSQLRSNLVDLANSKDDTGGNLFGGFSKQQVPFVEVGGKVSYQGDAGRHQLKVSESARVATGLDGASVFMNVQTDAGARDVFSMIDDLSFTLGAGASARKNAITAQSSLSLDLKLQRAQSEWSMTVTGPSGRANVSAEISDGDASVMVDALNEKTAETGVIASLDVDGRTIILTSASSGEITIENLEHTPPQTGVVAIAKPLEGLDQTPVNLVPNTLSSDWQVHNFQKITSHLADQRAAAGALGQVVNSFQAMNSDRQLIMEKARAGLEDLDVAKAITELQGLMTNRSVAQQTYAKIVQQSLFDYIR